MSLSFVFEDLQLFEDDMLILNMSNFPLRETVVVQTFIAFSPSSNYPSLLLWSSKLHLHPELYLCVFTW